MLAAQLADVESRATAYRLANARFPVMKTLAEFDFAGSPVNAGAVRELHRGGFLAESRNVVLIGGTGSGKTHLAIAIGANCVREREARVRFFNTVDLVNQLEADTRAGKAGRLATQLARTDLVILDELGYLPFPRAGGQMLFHLIRNRHSFWVGSLRSRPTSDAGERCRRHSQHRPCRTRNALYSPRRTRSHSVSRDRCSTRITSLKPGRHATSGLEPSRRARSPASSRTQTSNADRR